LVFTSAGPVFGRKALNSAYSATLRPEGAFGQGLAVPRPSARSLSRRGLPRRLVYWPSDFFGGAGENAAVSHTFQPSGRFSAANPRYAFTLTEP
jgi:hypothetical protein